MDGNRSRWLLVAKPLVPPFRDGSTVLVRDLVAELDGRFHVAYFGDPQRPLRSSATDTIIPAKAMGYAPGLLAKAKVLAQVVRPRHRHMAVHFFFTPNEVTSRVVASLRRMQPGRPMIQSLMSSHGASRWVDLLRPLDRVVVLSRHTEQALVDAGLASDRITCIPPGVAEVSAVADPAHATRVLYAGDLDGAVVQRAIALAKAMAGAFERGWRLTLACRPKAAEDARHRARLRAALSSQIAAEHVEILGEVEDMDGLLRTTSLQVFLADHVHNKVDLPLVLLEGMMRGVGVVTVDAPPVSELRTLGQAHGLQPGRAVADDELPQVVARATEDGETLRKWGEQARRLAVAELSIRQMARRYEALYEEMTDDR